MHRTHVSLCICKYATRADDPACQACFGRLISMCFSPQKLWQAKAISHQKYLPRELLALFQTLCIDIPG